MSERRFALVIANSSYTDPDLSQLSAPAQEAEALAKVLRNPTIGNFEVKTVINQPHYDVMKEIAIFFANRKPEDMLLLYFSCHGVTDDRTNELFFTAINTVRRPTLRATAIPSSWIRSVMEDSRSGKQVVLLDCCFSGAFLIGTMGDSTEVHAEKQLKGRGRAVMTASTAMQFAFEDQENTIRKLNEARSYFTDAIIDGLEKNGVEADVDGDGHISFDELYNYVYDYVRKMTLNQTPTKSSEEIRGQLLIAKSPKQTKKIIDSNYLLMLLRDGKVEEFNKLHNEQDVPLFFRRADLSNKKLTGVDLHEADLSETKLSKTKLNSSNLNSAKLKGADLSGAELGSADLYSANLAQANLKGAVLRGANLKGMIEFRGADLTGADLRGADLLGMVNFENAILHDVDFTGANMDNKLINFKGADILNCRGLAPVLPSNEYVKALKVFSEKIILHFKAHNVSPDQTHSIEHKIEDLIEEVGNVQEPGTISEVLKQKLYAKFSDMVQDVIMTLPKSSEILETFTILSPFSKIIGKEVRQLSDEMLKRDQYRDDELSSHHNKATEIDNKPISKITKNGMPQPLPQQISVEHDKRKGSPIGGSVQEDTNISRSVGYTSASFSSNDDYQHFTKTKQSQTLKILIPILIVGVVGSIIAFSVFNSTTTTTPTPTPSDTTTTPTPTPSDTTTTTAPTPQTDESTATTTTSPPLADCVTAGFRLDDCRATIYGVNFSNVPVQERSAICNWLEKSYPTLRGITKGCSGTTTTDTTATTTTISPPVSDESTTNPLERLIRSLSDETTTTTTPTPSQNYQDFQSCLSRIETDGSVTEQGIRDCFAPIYNTGTGTTSTVSPSSDTGTPTSTSSENYQDFQSCLSRIETDGSVTEQGIRDCFAPIYNTKSD
jgi:uncharacterized protein YjbI with pentapeptide repeats